MHPILKTSSYIWESHLLLPNSLHLPSLSYGTAAPGLGCTKSGQLYPAGKSLSSGYDQIGAFLIFIGFYPLVRDLSTG